MKIYFHAVALAFVIKGLQDRHLEKVRWVEHSDGSVHGVAQPRGWHIKQTFGAQDGVTILPSPGNPVPLSADHVSKLSRFGVTHGHSMADAVEKIMAAHPEVHAFDPDLPFPANSF
jgi:hypothetical protein